MVSLFSAADRIELWCYPIFHKNRTTFSFNKDFSGDVIMLETQLFYRAFVMSMKIKVFTSSFICLIFFSLYPL